MRWSVGKWRDPEGFTILGVQDPALFADAICAMGGGEFTGVDGLELVTLWSVGYIYNTLLFLKKLLYLSFNNK